MIHHNLRHLGTQVLTQTMGLLNHLKPLLCYVNTNRGYLNH